MVNSESLQSWRQRYEDISIDTIPLWANTKIATSKGWQLKPSAEQWSEVSDDFNGNIGVRTGNNGVVGLDGDDQQAVENIKRWLHGLGLQPPTVKTPSGMFHWYLRCDDVPEGLTYKNLKPDVGKGELRPKHYLAAPCSVVDGQTYAFIQGQPEEILTQTVVKWRDLKWLIPQQQETTVSLQTTPIPLIRRDIPNNLWQLLEQLQTAKKGQSIRYVSRYGEITDYASRSEAEAAIVCKLLLLGYHLDEIRKIFEKCRPGHYAEEGSRRFRYLERTYVRELNWLASDEIRTANAETYHKAETASWSGRGGPLELKAYLALLAVCWQCASWVVYASGRDLAEHAAATQPAMSKALRRIENRGLVTEVEPAHGINATKWEVHPLAQSYHMSQSFFLHTLVCDKVARGDSEIVGVFCISPRKGIFQGIQGPY